MATTTSTESTDKSLERARAAKAKAAKVFGRIADVVGVGITRIGGGYGLKINLLREPATGVVLPSSVDDVPVSVAVTGPITPR